jgi:hypothetical protein
MHLARNRHGNREEFCVVLGYDPKRDRAQGFFSSTYVSGNARRGHKVVK